MTIGEGTTRWGSGVVPAWVFAWAWTPPSRQDPCELDVEDARNPGSCIYCAGPIPHEKGQ